MLALAAVWTAAGAGRRLVAIADLHGDLHAGVRVLKLAGLVDDRQHWAGGDAVLVQTGDIVDRGGEAKQLYELFQRLAAEAAGRGGAVHNLLGNHDIMNMLGDVRYVNKSDYAHFGGAKARARAFSAAGELGQWLRSLPVALRLGDTVFVHAGITPEWAALGIDGINARTRAALGPSAGMSSRSSILGSNGPVWYRGYDQDGEARACATVRQALHLLGGTRMVVGHSIQDDRVRVRCAGQLHLIDIAMSSAIYGEHVVAWECVGCLELGGDGSGAREREASGAELPRAEPGGDVRIRAVYDDSVVPLLTGVPRLREDLRLRRH
ncbi:hypothetical protein KFE25_008331 [Diacronema lutheri]|uniref:Calcineurin-like phosphoesterase domain-containing protein n=2 Tax=Diacronema lutheri TaxID=2081491 RepID=A0A8J5XR91_DIALT|nr:hypothetical protein KFE25_008331 [Diacronema lutheri]